MSAWVGNSVVRSTGRRGGGIFIEAVATLRSGSAKCGRAVSADWLVEQRDG